MTQPIHANTSPLPNETILSTTNRFHADVVEGLHRIPKRLFSKYFYDQKGDQLFQRIMEMPEYYLTRSELDIFSNKTAEIADAIQADGTPFDLIELGAGDAVKSTHLLKHLVDRSETFTYMPIDISGNILSVLQKNLFSAIPELDVICLEGEYLEMLDKAASLSPKRKVVMFLGGNIGNMELREAYDFCHDLRQHLHTGDKVLMGFDLKKDPFVISNAYNDKAGITAAFNLNLLTRINRELKADFNTEAFRHYQSYDPISGACRSFLVSLQKQQVHIGNDRIHFEESEIIYMEVSWKFSKEDIEKLAAQSEFLPVRNILDSKGWFMDAIWEVI